MLSNRFLSRSSRFLGANNTLNTLLSSSTSLNIPNKKSESSTSSVAYYHRSVRDESGLIVAGAALIGGSIAAHYVIQGYHAYQAKLKEIEEREKQRRLEGISREEHPEKTSTRKKSEAKENIFSNVLNSSFFSRNFYDGGFEEKMTRREAALILGVRESSSVERIKESHRKILLLNHPDRGGSAFLAAKVNEAKDLLLKGKQ